MNDSVTLALKGNMSFDVDVNGHKMIIDSAEDFGGNNEGPRPKSLMLVALGGCTGMDVASILRKMRVSFTDFRIEVSGHITHDHPRHFDRMHIKYFISGKNISHEKVEQAVALSQEKFCGVSYSYKQSIELTSEIIYE
jgi:putative redox protein